jgi:hypothetical protein
MANARSLRVIWFSGQFFGSFLCHIVRRGGNLISFGGTVIVSGCGV